LHNGIQHSGNYLTNAINLLHFLMTHDFQHNDTMDNGVQHNDI